jgi:hypothetical protein
MASLCTALGEWSITLHCMVMCFSNLLIALIFVGCTWHMLAPGCTYAMASGACASSLPQLDFVVYQAATMQHASFMAALP